MLLFEWDQEKAKGNIKNHGISFEEASSVFGDVLSLTIYDPIHSEKEDRFILIGNSFKNRIIVVIHTERVDKIRIISARNATKNERMQYEKNTKKH